MNFHSVLSAYTTAKSHITFTHTPPIGAPALEVAGLVTWDSISPSGISYQTHKLTFIDAIETAKNILYAAAPKTLPPGMRINRWWMAVGLNVAVVLATLPQFIREDADSPPGFWYLGTLFNCPAFCAVDRLGADEFVVGNDFSVVNGKVLNYPENVPALKPALQ